MSRSVFIAVCYFVITENVSESGGAETARRSAVSVGALDLVKGDGAHAPASANVPLCPEMRPLEEEEVVVVVGSGGGGNESETLKSNLARGAESENVIGIESARGGAGVETEGGTGSGARVPKGVKRVPAA